MEGKLRLCVELEPEQIDSFLHDYHAAGEDCYVLYRLKEGQSSVFKDRIRIDHGTEYLAYVVGEKVVGVARITKNPNPANGVLGYCIRPDERGKGYAKAIVKEAINFARVNKIENFTAVVHTKNSKSMHILVEAGFKPTGIVYDWIPEPEKRKAIEFAL